MNNGVPDKIDILSLSLAALETQLKARGEASFRARQVFLWLHQKRAVRFEEMSNLSHALRQMLEAEYRIIQLELVKKQTSQIDGTVKYLFSLPDKQTVESVVMTYKHGTTLCISSQVGCRMGCTFCASTVGGLARNLTPAELIAQVYFAEKDMGTIVNNVVLMGIGEPLDNFDNVLVFLETISSPDGKNMSLRNMTLSTCGLVDEIVRLAKRNLPLTLSISLHAVTDEERQRIMPVAKQWTIRQLLDAAADYFSTTGRRITYEYALILHVNDSTEQAKKLAQLLRGQNAHVNLIPVNPARKNHERSEREAVLAFLHVLQENGISATIRRELGADIDAACGQLRRSTLDASAEKRS